ncbi:11903_t:CDS:2 [Cetraspora pellucida]|uniref:11892_t:CDS:1 n=2 Tax=Cetraspora pellucida TaxID=1433469 RepID=A0ACA9JYE5_9GLOM|nr:11892_t:CDS:2 [Cetraspora pellucida]CAG8440403.1 11903_t:CDS:2 [Cetraspora pellucida]
MVKTTYVIRDGKKLVVPAIPNVSKYITLINQLKAELEAEKVSRDNWKDKFENAEIKLVDLPANWRTELVRITDLEKRPDIPISKKLNNKITKLQGEKQQIIKERDNYKTQLTQKENQLEQTIKDFQEKEKTKHQEYLNILTKKDQD